MRARVDCGLGLVMLSFCPTMRLSRVDLPALGLPATVTVPARVMVGKVMRVARGGGRGGAGCGERKKPPLCEWGLRRGAGDGLLSRALSSGVPSAL